MGAGAKGSSHLLKPRASVPQAENMIEPLVSETEWAPVWQAATPWQPLDRNMLVIAPHPDDETLAAGGLIARQLPEDVPIHVVAASLMGRTHITMELISPSADPLEQTSALKRL